MAGFLKPIQIPKGQGMWPRFFRMLWQQTSLSVPAGRKCGGIEHQWQISARSPATVPRFAPRPPSTTGRPSDAHRTLQPSSGQKFSERFFISTPSSGKPGTGRFHVGFESLMLLQFNPQLARPAGTGFRSPLLHYSQRRRRRPELWPRALRDPAPTFPQQMSVRLRPRTYAKQ